MKNNHSPNFEPKDIVQGIAESINAGQTKSNLASQGSDWESVVDVLDEAEHDIGKEMSVNSHLNSVMFNDDFNKQYEKTLPLNATPQVAGAGNTYISQANVVGGSCGWLGCIQD